MLSGEDSRKRIGTLSILCLLVVFFKPAVADDQGRTQERYFNIPQQRADVALIEFAEQADITLIFTFDLARDKTTNRLVGTYEPAQAIELLLKDTGLKPTFGIDGHINIAPAEEPLAEGDEMPESKKIGVLAVMASLFASPFADAQSEDQDALEEVIVVGIREALNNSIADKRNATEVVDSLVMGDIGELPTISIGDSLEFLPGVSGTRFRGNVDQISFRGLPQLFAQSTVNGRELTSGNGNRFVRYRIWPSNFFSKAVLSKSPLPDQVEGGISGVMDLQTLSALDYNGPMLNLDVRAQDSPFNDNNDLIDDRGLRATAQFTSSTDTANGEFGLVLAADYMDNPVAIGQSYFGGYSRRTLFGEPVITPNTAQFSNDTEEFERIGGLVVLEWRSENGTSLKFDGIVSRTENPQKRTFFQINNLNTPNRYVNAVIEGGALQSGTLQNLLVLSRFEDIDREDPAFMMGLNLKTQFGAWHAEFDTFMSETEVDMRLDRPLFRATNVGADFEFANSEILFSNFSKDLTDPSNWGAHQYFVTGRFQEDESHGFKVDFDRDLTGFFTGLRVGARYSNRSIYRNWPRINNNDVRNANLYPEFAIGALDSSLFASPYIDYDLRDDTRGAFPTAFSIWNREAVLEAFPPAEFGTPTNDDLLSRYIDNEETGLAAYIRADFETAIGGKPVTGAVGVRVVKTDLTANGFSGTPVAVTDPDTGAVTIEVPGDLTPARQTNDYTEVLPSLNLKIDFTDSLVGRLSVARTMARPNFIDLRLAQNLNGGDIDNQPFTGSAGNPLLDPMTADQVDLTLEWYPTEGTALTGAIYYKDVSGFVVNDVRPAIIDGYQYELTSPINLDSAEFSGIELAFRHDFDYLPAPLDGLGILLNGTLNHTSADPEYGVLKDTDETSGEYLYDVVNRNPGVEGFAEKTASGLIFYQKGRWSIRASVKYLSDRIRNVASLNAPNVAESQKRYDFAASFKVNKMLRLQFQAFNLTEEPLEAYYAFDNYTGAYQQIGRQYFLGASLRL